MKRMMRLTLSADPKNVAVARIAVCTFAAEMGFRLSEIEEIKVAISEAVSNAVLHAYPQGEGEVWVHAWEDDFTLVVMVRDTGRGIADIAKAREPGYSTVPEHMGLGFSFMESFMDHLSVFSAPGEGVELQMKKRPCTP